MAIPAPISPYSIGALEGAGVSFAGAFVSALLVIGATVVHAAEVGALAGLVYLGYHAYQSSP